MKKLYALVCLSYASILLCAGCGTSTIQQDNRQQKGVPMARIKTDSGLQYEVMREGSGALPKPESKVTVHYTGWLDFNGQPGKKFDSSLDRNKPFTFIVGVGQVIKGWDEGVMNMKVGEKRRLYIPARLGYGARGAGDRIPPHADLIFDVELIKIN